MSYTSEVLADSPLIYYRFENTSGNLPNEGSLGGTATVGSSATRGVTGIPLAGLGYSFNGTTNSVTEQSISSDLYRNGSFSIEMWINIPSKTEQTLMYHFNTGWWVSTDGLGMPYVGGGGLSGNTTAKQSVIDGEWHHLVITTATGSTKIYLDGTLRNTIAAKITPSSLTSNLMMSDRSNAEGTYTMNGRMDEFALYTTALSAARVLAHYTAGVGAAVSYEATPVDINVSSTTPELILNEIKISAETASVNVNSPDASAVITWDGSRTENIVNDEFTPTSGPWGSDWITDQGRFGEVKHTSSGGRVSSGTAMDDAAYAISAGSAVGDLSLTVDILERSGSNTRTAWGLVTEVPSLRTTRGDVGWEASEGILVGRTSIVVTGPSDTVTYLPTQTIEKFTISGKVLKVYTGSGALNATYTLPTGAVPSQPLRAFIGAGELVGTSVGEGFITVDKVVFSNTRKGVIYTPTVPTVNISTPHPSKPHYVNAGVSSVSVSAAADAVVEIDNDPNAYDTAVRLKGAETFYKGELSGKDYLGSADLTLESVTYTEGMTRGSSAFYFDGTGIGTSTPPISGRSTDGWPDYTLEAWIKVTGVYNPEGSGDFWDNIGQVMKLTDTDMADGHMMMGVRSRDMGAAPGGAEFHLDYGGMNELTTLDDGQWHHLVMVRRGLKGYDVDAYIDGTHKGSFGSGNHQRYLDLDMLTIGDNVIGAIDNIAIYPRRLTYSEIIENHNLGRAEIASNVEHVYYTAEASTLDISVSDVTIDTIKSVAYPAQSISTSVNASGHGWHAVRNADSPAQSVNVNVSLSGPVVTGNEVANVNTDAVTIDLSTVVPEVSAADSVSLAVTIVDVEVTSLNARGGDPNKNMLFEAIETTVLVPNGAYAVGGHDETMSAETISINIEVDEPSVSNMTDVLIQAAKIGVDVKLVGFYNREDDKWADFVESTIGGNDAVWHRFNEVDASQGALDEWGLLRSGGRGGYHGAYLGTPTFGISALDNRKAVRLNGGNDCIRTGVRPEWPDESYSQEIIFRTSDTGVLMGGGRFASRTTAIVVTDAGIEVQYFDNYVLTASWSSPIKVNDGQWHQVIWFEEDPEDPGFYGKWTLMIDGQVAMSRSPMGGGGDASRADMYMIGGFGTGTKIPVKNLAVDVMEFVSRDWSGFSRSLGLESWSILNGFTFIKAGVSNISVESRDARGKGNRKKMLIIYYVSSIADSSSLNALAEWSGVRIPGLERYADGSGWQHYGQSGEWKGYQTYSVEIARPVGDKGLLAPTPDGIYIDNYSGMPRYIDLDTDLAVDVTEFDVIHVAHWPGPSWDSDALGTWALSNTNTGWNDRIKETYYTQAKDGLIKTLRSAVDKGVSLWISDPQQAVDMGIAKGFDVHSHMREQATGLSGTYRNEPLRLRVAELESQYAPLGPHEAVKFSKGDNYKIPMPGSSVGYDTNPERETSRFVYLITDQEYIGERDIVSTAEDFSEFETNYIGENISWEGNYDYTSHTGAHAYNVERRPNGLQMGSRMTMVVYDAWADSLQTRREGNHNVHSLRPEGLVGQVIAREQFTYMDGNVERSNPWGMNATTVLLDRGTILNGTPLGGRIFVETMDNYRPVRPAEERGGSPNFATFNIARPMVVSDEFRNFVNGREATDAEASKWDFDSRRMSITFNWTQTSYWRGDNKYYLDVPISEYGDPGVVTQYYTLPYFGMNDRGLVWMGVRPEETFGQAKVFAEVVDVSVETRTPEVKSIRHASVSATLAEVRVQFRKPHGLADPDVTVNTTPVTISITGGTFQRIINAKAAEIEIYPGEPTPRASGEDAVVYLRSESFTFYLGDD